MIAERGIKMKNTTNMTQGSILKKLILFSIPILLGNVFQQLYNVADTAIIGNVLGDKAIAAVGAAAPVYNLVIGLSLGLTNGFAVIIARFFGAGDERSLKRSVALTYCLSGITAVVMTAASLIGLRPLLRALNTPSDIIGDTQSYMRIIMAFSVLTIAYNMLAGMMRAIGNSKAPLYFLIVSCFANIGLDILFVKFLGLGVAGAAYATVISQGLSVVMCFIYALKKCSFLIFKRKHFHMDKHLIGELTSTGISMGLMFAIVSVGSVILQSAVNGFGTTTITSHSAARKLDEMFMMPMSTMAMAVSTFTSQNYGAGKVDRVRCGIRYGFILTAAWSVVSIFVCVVFCRPLIHLITGTTDSEVLAVSARYIRWNVPFFFVLGVLVVLRSSLQGVGKKLIPIMGSVVEFALKVLVVMVLAPKLGYFGVCIVEPIIWTVCAGIVVADYALFLRGSSQQRGLSEAAAV